MSISGQIIVWLNVCEFVCVNVCDAWLVVFHVLMLFILLFKLFTVRALFVMVHCINHSIIVAVYKP